LRFGALTLLFIFGISPFATFEIWSFDPSIYFLYLGDSFTIVKDRKKEIGPGLLASMLADLGLTKEDLR
jgi:hypothetical protein